MNDLTAQTRAAIIISMLLEKPQTARALAEATELSVRSVYYVLDNIAIATPVTNSGGIWYMLTTDEHMELNRILHKLEAELAQAKHNRAYAHPLPVADVARILHYLRRFVCAPEPE